MKGLYYSATIRCSGAAPDGPVAGRPAGRRGRSRKKGKRLAALAQTASAITTQWQEITFAEWDGISDKPMETATDTAVWSHSGKPPITIRWVVLRDPKKKLPTTALLSTDLALTAEQIVSALMVDQGNYLSREP